LPFPPGRHSTQDAVADIQDEVRPMAFMRTMGADSVAYHRETVIERGDDHPAFGTGHDREVYQRPKDREFAARVIDQPRGDDPPHQLR
jgi:hypothetical protein